ncbi:hypothetical protein ETAA8_43080 [Anatilimnocola aggregata]|uniref:Uncharacterized protein n=1 Tax=Anatilimnocola aggregata TaxID=2528021 RepID=A0A517YG73_9BACT|nr:hypothetical protein [Anatilimnocola aggregata]QDU29201.1 hypothetical protein ETAA8_43080 [Anatilimnocola aggregata]
MQLDNTRISIRERNLLETVDLSFRVLREFWKPWLICSLLAIVPLAILNALLLGWMAADMDFVEEWPARYFWTMAVFIYFEAPLASIFVVGYMGPAVFMEKPTIKQVFWDTLRQFPSLFIAQCLLRCVLPVWLLAAMMDRIEPNWPIEAFVIPFLLLPLATAVRAFRPYINEIILLEKNPLRSNNPQVLTIGKRSAHLHGPYGSDLFVRWLGTLLISLALVAMIGVSTLTLQSVLFSNSELNWLLVYIWYPAVLWTVVSLISLVRFLDYLDLRIRHEGWEVELLMKAEALRLKPNPL